MNQSWFGLTPLILVTAQSSRSPATDRRSSSGSNSTSNITLLIKLFLDHGADPSQGLPLEQFNTLRRLKTKKIKEFMKNINTLNSLNQICTPSESNKIVSVPHQFGMKTKKIKEDIEKFAKGKWVLPIDIAAISGNIDIVRTLLSKLVIYSHIY